tara:strand:+ start:158 stop:1489 length:1332 start_codon:yes stop_codon:yes gene_type:complete
MALTEIPVELSSTPGIADSSNATAITIDSSERVLIGTDSGDAFNADSMLRIGRTGDRAFLHFKTDADQESGILFGDVDDDVECAIEYEPANKAMTFSTNNNTETMRLDSSGKLLHGTDTVPTGVLLGNQLVSSSATGAEIIAFRADTAIEAGDKTGAFLLGNSDSSGTEDHFVGMYGKAFDTFGRQHLHFVAGRDNYENDTPQMTLTSNGGIQLGTTSNNYTHDAGMRIVTSEVGSNYLDAALSLHGSGGDFYAQNWTGPSDTGFGLLTVFSGTTDYMIYAYRASSSNTSILQLYENGDVQVHGALSKGSGSFRITHPLPAKKDTHDLVHSFIEGPQADLIYRGAVDLVGGSATVNLDTAGRMTEGTFVLLNTNTQCFTSNESGWTPVKGSVSGNILTITAQDNTCTDTISWMVVGERHDQHMKDTSWTDSDGRPITEPLKRD